MKVNICGIMHNVIEKSQNFGAGSTHFGEIDYGKCEIMINEEMDPQVKQETICHEILHGMLVHIGREDLSADEQFVTALANAINQGFTVKDVEEACTILVDSEGRETILK